MNTHLPQRQLPRLKRQLRAVLLIITAGWLTPNQTASAQWAPDIERPWQSIMTRQAFDALVEAIQPDEQLTLVLQELFRAHSESFDQIAKEGRVKQQAAKEALAALQAGGNAKVAVVDAAGLELKKLECEFASKLSAVDSQFDEDVLVLLDAEQEQAWRDHQLEQAWTRVASMKSLVPWGNVRLTEVAGRMNFDADLNEKLAPVFAEYEAAVMSLPGEILAASIKRARTSWQRMERGLRYGQRMSRDGNNAVTDDEKLQAILRIDRQRFAMDAAIIKREMAPQVVLRTINRAFVDRIAEMLPPDRIAPFKREIDRASDALGMRTTRMHRVIGKLLKLEGLSKERRATFSEALVQLHERLDSLDERRAKVREDDFRARWSGSSDPDKAREIQARIFAIEAERDSIVAEELAKLQAILSPEETAAVAPPATSAPATKPAD